MTFCGNPLSRSLSGVKRTCPFALHMSANDPKRTLGLLRNRHTVAISHSPSGRKKMLGFSHLQKA